MNLHTKSRDGLYEATAVFCDGFVKVCKGSQIRMPVCKGYIPNEELSSIRSDTNTVSNSGILLVDVTFNSLSTAATFVTGRISNGMKVWKTDDNQYVGKTLKPDKYT